MKAFMQRSNWATRPLAIILGAVILAVGITVVGNVTGLRPAQTAEAFDCGGWNNGQQDTWAGNGTSMHGWLGFCWDSGFGGSNNIYYYSGEDNGGWWTYMYLSLRGWVCGTQIYGTSISQQSTQGLNLQTGTNNDGCGAQADSNYNENDGSTNWWSYLNY